MKRVGEMTPEELREAAFDAIEAALGPRGLARFIAESGLGMGDYARDRHKWLDKVDIVADLEKKLGRRA